MSYCQLGDSPTIYYKFKGQPNYAKVTFERMAPIDIQIDSTGDDDGGGTDANTGDGQTPSIPCPPEGKVCHLTATGSFYFSEGQLGQRQTFSADGWQITEVAVEYDEENGLKWQVTATTYYQFSRGITRPSPPDYYADSGVDFSGWQLADDCFPNGGDPLTCSDSPPSSPPPPPSSPPPPDTKAQVKLKVFYQTKLIWSKTGEPPLDYEVSCSKEECPPGMCKLNNAQGFCCIKSDELKEPINIIKSILRHRNG
ncbi:hypothetical protein [Allocoleopsis sp.]|uniref:hypothetical protein n=1 Tax=Allocoleopsis sp. TaxID=3088169 RepID=UPI002FD16CE3